MSGLRAGALVLAGRLMRYPGPTYVDDLRAFAEVSAQLGLDSSQRLKVFADEAEDRSVEDLQEMFTQTFDMTPKAALEVGWHLFGEDYARGAFLVDMRAKLRRHDIPEGSELPDHLASLVTLVTRMDAEEADAFVASALLPAVEKMLGSLQETESPFVPAMSGLREVLLQSVPAHLEVSHA